MKLLLRKSWGLAADPWAALRQPTPDLTRAIDLIHAAVEARAMVSILGARGAGKTHAVCAALRVLDARVIEPLRLSRERMHIGDIETALVYGLSDESPRRSAEARSHQVRRLLGVASRQQPVLLVIDDAHVLHGLTLKAMKRLREMAWQGRSPLLSIVLVGQTDKTACIPEIGLRSDRLWMVGLTRDDARSALHQALNRYGRVRIRPAAIDLIAQSDRARNWLDLQALADECLAEATARGVDVIDVAVVRALLEPEPGGAECAAPVRVDDAAVAAHLERAAA